ncbi:MAG: YicC/YloC family endoribonuclease, partial [Pseudomonadota bacterium]
MTTKRASKPLYGMTGYARRELRVNGLGIAWELRSLNHRYLDLALRLPEEFRALESQVRSVLGGSLHRGKVEASLRLLPAESGVATRLELDQTLLEQLLAGAAQLRERVPEVGPMDPMSVLTWPGVLLSPKPDLGPLVDGAVDLLRDTLGDLLAARAREGERIRELLQERAAGIAREANVVREQAPALREALRERATRRLANFDVEVDSARLEQELAITLTRLDVDEELDRLQGHLDDLHHALAQGGA